MLCFGRDDALPQMNLFRMPARSADAAHSGPRAVFGAQRRQCGRDESPFESFKAETLPIVEHFKAKGKCVEIDTSQDRQTVYNLVRAQLADQTDAAAYGAAAE